MKKKRTRYEKTTAGVSDGQKVGDDGGEWSLWRELFVTRLLETRA